MLTLKTVSVVVACYRDAGSVQEMYRRLTETLAQVTPSYEIIFVNDASPDNAEELLNEIAAEDNRVTVISHSRNFGSQMAFTSGMRQSVGQAVALMEVVYGLRASREEGARMHALRRWFYRVYRRLSYVDVPLDAGDFSVMSRRVVDSILLMPERDRFLRGLRSWVGFHQTGVPYVRAERFAGESTNSWLDNIRWAKRAIFSLSYQPLELISLLAFIVTLLTAIAIVVYLLLYFANPDAPRGFMTLLVAVLFIGAVQLFSLSIIAEYLGRIFEEVKQRPHFIVRNIVNDHRQ
jgi:dolichol-phosphate mannosyltransferase